MMRGFCYVDRPCIRVEYNYIVTFLFCKSPARGFTLIELLVVISIIALLSSIVFAGISTARAKAADVRVIQELEGLRKQLEIDRASDAYSLDCSSGQTFCTLTTLTDGTLSGMPGWTDAYIAIAKDIYNLNQNAIKLTLTSVPGILGDPSPATGYAIYARLPSTVGTTGKYACVDSRGGTLNPAPLQGAGADASNADQCR